MEQPTIRRGKRLWWSSPNPTIKHNRKLVFQKIYLVCPLNMVVKEISLTIFRPEPLSIDILECRT
jgi:hypothetical protein